MNDAGYHEASIALWQAVIEFLLSRPQLTDQSEALTSFESYWESEVPRIGEDDWVAWSTYDEENATLPQPITAQSSTLETSGPDLVERFVRAERQMEEVFQFPGRTIDDAAEDDPFHVVLFADLESVLSTLSLIPNTQLLVVAAFLCYAGLPSLQNGSFGDAWRWWWDPFLKHDGYGSNDNSLPASWRALKYTTLDLFDDAMDIDLGARKDWISNILKVFVQRFPDHENLCEYYIAFRLKQFGPS
jgi:hypothetical protein